MLLKMSVSGSILILLTILLRFFAINRLPKKIFVLLWNIAILRLLVPFDLPIHYGLASPMENIVESSVSHYHAANKPVIMETLKEPVNDTVALSLGSVTWITIVWVAGMVILLVIFCVLYWKEYQKIQAALPVSKEIEKYFRSVSDIPNRVKFLVSDRISTPLTVGVLSPKIIFPKIFKISDNTKIKYVLTHELIHIKRLDNLWKIMILIAVCVHWFNPFVWIMYRLFNRDIELSCDEKVITLLGETAKKEYIMTLVDLAEKQYQWSSISNGFGKNAIQERVVAIMKFKKATFISIGCTMFLLAGAVTVFAQNDFKATGNDISATSEIPGMEDKEEADEVFSHFNKNASDKQTKDQPMGIISRLTKEELPNKVRVAINSCDDEKWYMIGDAEYQYIYFNGLPANYAFQPKMNADSHSGTLSIFDMGTSTGNYVLLAVERDVSLKIFYNNSQVVCTEKP